MDARPWTVKVYVASSAALPLLLLVPSFDLTFEWSSIFGLLLLLGAWVGSRIAWGLTLALDSFSFVLGLVSTAGGAGLVVVGLLAIWIGLLLAAPTQRWVGLRGPRPDIRQAA